MRTEGAGLAVGELLASARGRDFLHSVGFRSGDTLFACSSEDRVEDLVARLPFDRVSHVVFLLRGDLQMCGITRLADEQTPPGGQVYGTAATVGMLFDAAAATGERVFTTGAQVSAETGVSQVVEQHFA